MRNIACILTLMTWCFILYAQPDFNTVNWQQGFLDFHWEDDTGKMYVRVDELNTELLYTSALAAGVGSNDLGLDRGQLGDSHVVTFERAGNKIMLRELNYDYRALTDRKVERRAIEEAFAHSILWGFELIEKTPEGYIIEFTSFLLRDAHSISITLSEQGEGTYRIDNSRSAVYLPRTKSFPKNTEFESTLTYTGNPTGRNLSTVVPSPTAITVRQHHSFVALPDDNYQPRNFDPRCGYFPLSFHDYSSPIHENIEKQYITRHRLTKKSPHLTKSEVVAPIIYYVDPGAPEPIRSALMEGAAWWNQAFETAGFINAFQVKLLPEDTDPLDVRYNVIQWVHRSTRGWSYGASVIDPRTGEILKGHVSLGSLRVRQDYLIAQGLLPAFGLGGGGEALLMELALARLRQLSAHEVGHTLGLAHNFAASTNQRASVMDYPHPIVNVVGPSMDFSSAYDDKIGAWDKRAIQYGYTEYTSVATEQQGLEEVLDENENQGLDYISDADARPSGGAHPSAHLWDNGDDAVAEFYRLSNVRATALANFGLDNLPSGSALSSLEDILVPLYLSHRYQVEALVKLIGGVDYSYYIKNENQHRVLAITPARQQEALEALLTSIDPAFLRIPERILTLIPPPAYGKQRGREHFKNRSAPAFDPLAAAEAAANHSLGLLLQSQRMSRLIEQHGRDRNHPSISSILTDTYNKTAAGLNYMDLDLVVAEVVQSVFVHRLMDLAMDRASHHQVRGAAYNQLAIIKTNADLLTTHGVSLARDIEDFMENPTVYSIPAKIKLPDGSPIGCGH